MTYRTIVRSFGALVLFALPLTAQRGADRDTPAPTSTHTLRLTLEDAALAIGALPAEYPPAAVKFVGHGRRRVPRTSVLDLFSLTPY